MAMPTRAPLGGRIHGSCDRQAKDLGASTQLHRERRTMFQLAILIGRRQRIDPPDGCDGMATYPSAEIAATRSRSVLLAMDWFSATLSTGTKT
jgi:hypothetical protein